MGETVYGKRLYSTSQPAPYTLSGSAWTPVLAPFQCNYVNLHNRGSVDILYSTVDPAIDATHVDTLNPGDQDPVSVVWPKLQVVFRYLPRQIVCWVKGDSVLVCTFVL